MGVSCRYLDRPLFLDVSGVGTAATADDDDDDVDDDSLGSSLLTSSVSFTLLYIGCRWEFVTSSWSRGTGTPTHALSITLDE